MVVTAQISAGLAFVAGLLSFLSPCVLPLIPSYLSFVGGTTLGDLERNRSTRLRVLSRSVFFVLGFSLVFVALGVAFSAVLGGLGRLTRVINLAAGLIVVFLGLNTIFDFWGLLARERRAHVDKRPRSIAGALLVGMAFAAGWAPCVGPILSSILLLAGTQGTIAPAAILLMIYSLGLGLPFLLTGFFFSRARRLLDRLRPRMRAIKTTSGLFLIGIGFLIAFGRMQRFNTFLFGMASRLRGWELARPDLARWLFAGIFAAVAGVTVWLAVRRKGSGRRVNAGPGAPAPLPSAGGTARRVRPVILAFSVVLLGLAALTAAGLLRPTGLLAIWFSYQGI